MPFEANWAKGVVSAYICQQKKNPRREKLRPNPLRWKLPDPLNMHEKILIVEDDAVIRMALADRLQSEGYSFEQALDGDEGLRKATQGSFDLVILDILMPGLNGIELQQSLLAQGRHIPIIFVTAFPEERMRARAIEAGALGFLGKPFDSSTLVELIDKALEIGRKS